MIEYPDWSDLNMGPLTSGVRITWDQELARLQHYSYYFDGLVFDEKVPGEAGTDAPLMFPVGMNLVKMLTIAQADATFGEWDEAPVRFGVRQDEEVKDADRAAIQIAQNILEHSNGASMLWEHELDRQVFGGGALKISPDLIHPARVRWSRVPRDCFFPIPDPDNPDELLEVYIVVPMTAEQARVKYGIEPRTDIVRRVEHWTRTEYTNRIDDILLGDYSGYNPWGVVPFVYTPRLRHQNWWGEALTPDIIPVQDELNARVADIGEAINYNAHPVRWGLNLPRDFNAENFPLGANAMWNLGRSIGSSPEPKVGLLEASAAVSQGVFEHINFIYDWARTSVFAPPIAFGEDNGGGQRSGVTLEIRMWPLIKSIRRSRAYLYASLMQALRISATILKQKALPNIPARAIDSLLEDRIVPNFFNILPRDQQAAVDEVVKLLSTNPPAISLETAQTILGRGSGEVKRIEDMLEEKELWANALQLEREERNREMAQAELSAQKPPAKETK